MLTNTALSAIKNAFIAMVSSAKFTIGGTDYAATIQATGVTADALYIRLSKALNGSQTGSLTKVTLYNSSNSVLWEKTEDMAVDTSALSLQYTVTIQVDEVS